MKKLSSKPDRPGVVYSKYISELSGTFSLRTLDLDRDGDMLVNWVNQPYAQQFWQMQGEAEPWRQMYEKVLASPGTHAFIGCFDEEPICEIDVYLVQADELQQHIDAGPSDAGFHILMGPPREMQKGFSFYAIKCLQEYYFSFDTSGDLYAEPDQQNYHANRLAINTGFRFLKTISLSYKTANLYRIIREEFSK